MPLNSSCSKGVYTFETLLNLAISISFTLASGLPEFDAQGIRLRREYRSDPSRTHDVTRAYVCIRSFRRSFSPQHERPR